MQTLGSFLDFSLKYLNRRPSSLPFEEHSELNKINSQIHENFDLCVCT